MRSFVGLDQWQSCKHGLQGTRGIPDAEVRLLAPWGDVVLESEHNMALNSIVR